MTTSGSYNVRATQRDWKAEIERLAAQARLGWEKEARILLQAGLKDGMSILELGSGPGFITQQLLELAPHSTITCLEVDRALLEQAQEYLPSPAKDRVRFVQGSVTNTPLADNRFDFAFARYLFQHLPDPLGAAREIWRVLKPGGRFVIHDIDDGIFGLVDPMLPEFPDLLEKFAQAQAARGGNRHIGRQLWRILKAAGFGNLRLEVLAGHSDEFGLEPFLALLDPDRMLPLVRASLLSGEEMESLRGSYKQFLASPQPYVLILGLMVYGEKPGAPAPAEATEK